MVKRIKKKVKITPFTRYVVSLAMVVSPQFQPSRERTFPLVPFDPPALLSDFFHEHFDVELLISDRFLSFEEYRNWITSARPGEIYKKEFRNGLLHFKPANPDADLSTDCIFLPMLGAATESDWERIFDDWAEGLTELQSTIFQHLIEPVLGIVPAVDKCHTLGPAPAKSINQAIFYLHGRVSDDCKMNQWPVPPLFPILDFKIVENLPEKSPISF